MLEASMREQDVRVGFLPVLANMMLDDWDTAIQHAEGDENYENVIGVMQITRDFRLATPRGVSTLGQLVITREKLALEKGKNDSLATAKSITVPATICGAIEKTEDGLCRRIRVFLGEEVTGFDLGTVDVVAPPPPHVDRGRLAPPEIVRTPEHQRFRRDPPAGVLSGLAEAL